MTRHAVVAFERELDELFLDRTHRLRALVTSQAGRPPTWNRARVTEAIWRLQELATECLVDELAEWHFDSLIVDRHRWFVTPSKGRGWREKRRTFDQWYDENVRHSNCVYIFWGKGYCRYIGRTVRGRGRPGSHFEKQWFHTKVQRIDIFATSQASEVPRLECLAMHRFCPTENQKKAARSKWTKRCPVCEVRTDIQRELRRIFGFRK